MSGPIDVNTHPEAIQPGSQAVGSVPNTPENALKNPNFGPDGSYQPIKDSVDFTNATNDIGKNAKKTLGMYLSKRTSGKDSVHPGEKNSFPISEPGEDQAIFAKNNTLGLESTGLGALSKTTTNEKILSSFFTDEQISNVLDKGEPGISNKTLVKSGHTLLNSFSTMGTAENDISKNILESIYTELLAANMYSPAEEKLKFIQNPHAGAESEATKGLFSIQRTLGSFNNTSEHVTTRELSTKVISMLASKTTKENPFVGSTMVDLLNDDQKSSLSGIYPWALQDGSHSPRRQDYNRTRIFMRSNSRIPGDPTPGADDYNSFIDLAAQCYLNILSTAMGIKASIEKNRFVALNDKQGAISVPLLWSGNPPGLLTYGQRESRRWANAYEQKTTDYKSEFNLDNDFIKCLQRGLRLFFGLTPDTNTITVLDLAKVAGNLGDSSGYYLSVFRSLAANSTNSPSAPSSDPFSGQNSDPRSKLYKFTMVIAAMGDISFKSQNGMRDVTPSERLFSKEASRIASPAILTGLGMIPPWAGVATIRKHISRWSPVGAYDVAPGANPLSLHTFYAIQKRDPNVGRASTKLQGMRAIKPSKEAVQQVEDALDAEYMPFYIHDIRTDELISMPAFILSFTENFAVEYTSTKGMGRQDPVKTYSGAERTISLSFKLVSFNEEDFDHIWLTVNKLVAMCYPQYSAGRKRVTSDGKIDFIQPFSQVPGASPLVRLRLGDLFKSNYSKFGLAKLFGAGQSATKDTAPTIVQTDSSIGEAIGLTALKAVPNALQTAYAVSDVGIAPAQGLYDEGSISQSTVLNYISNDQANDIRMLKDFAFDAAYDANRITADAGIEAQAALGDNFFDAKKNSIVASFDSTKGRGLAGFITSLALDYEGSTWEISPGKKAPKNIKVTMNFSPIHDLPLGLDYDGNLRNPSHPTGRFAGSYGDVYDNFYAVDRGPGAADKTLAFSKPKDFNQVQLGKKWSNKQVAADVLLDVAKAIDDAIYPDEKQNGGNKE